MNLIDDTFGHSAGGDPGANRRLRLVNGSRSPEAADPAAQLVADLAALVDAGLVVVHRRGSGPWRYALTSGPSDVSA
jgi:hypothetical protein